MALRSLTNPLPSLFTFGPAHRDQPQLLGDGGGGGDPLGAVGHGAGDLGAHGSLVQWRGVARADGRPRGGNGDRFRHRGDLRAVPLGLAPLVKHTADPARSVGPETSEESFGQRASAL